MPSVVVVDGNADLRFLISPLLRLDGTLLSRLGRLGLKPTRVTRAGPRGSADQEVMRVRGGLVLLLLGYLISLTLCAEARPPDPTWIAGIYDDDDDVVCLLTSGSGAIETGAFAKAQPLLPVAGWVSALESDWPLIFPGLSPHSRAPPAS